MLCLMRKIQTCLLIGVALLAPAMAQTQAAPKLGKPVFELSVLGPAAWQARFGPTNIGSLLASANARELWEPQIAALQKMGDDSLGRGNNLFAILRERTASYGGEVRLVGWMPAAAEDAKQTMAMGVVLGPDGKTDLAQMAQMLTEVLGKAAEASWEERQVGDQKLKVIDSNGQRICAPVLDGDRLWLAYGASEFESAVELTRAITMGVPKGDLPAVSLRLDAQAALAAATETNRREVALFGFSAVRQVQIQLRPAGPQVSLDLSAEFVPGTDRGVLAALFPRAAALSRFAMLVPKGTTAWKAGHFDPAQLYRTVELFAADMENSFRFFESEEDKKKRPDVETIRKGYRAKATEELGVDPVDGLLAYIDTDGLICGNLEDLDARGQMLFAMGLRDEKAFQAGLDRVLEKGKGFVNKMEDLEHGDVKFGRYGVPLLGNVYCAVGHGMLVIAGGEDGEGQVKRLLDAERKVPAKSDPAASVPPMPEEFAPLTRHLPPGCNGMGACSIALTLQLLSTGMREIMGPVVGGQLGLEAFDDEALEKLTELLQAHHLDRVRAMSGYADETWRCRLFW